jgi:sterol desaturase/sphingolipid hydroxylase (fatty acid hydroxylase superfamily)
MRLSKWSYYADFAVYPLLIVAACAASLWRASFLSDGLWLLALVAGWMTWTVLEYVLHRWVLHGIAPFRDLHTQHHAHPSALIGTPTWLSASLFIGLWALVAHLAPRSVAGGLAAGLMIGYLVYTLIHDAVHHRLAQPGSWLFRAKLRHAQHHRPGARIHYGVSSQAWDKVFGTGFAG